MRSRLVAATFAGLAAGTLAVGAVAVLGDRSTPPAGASVPPTDSTPDSPVAAEVNRRTITVEGTGKVTVKPDTATVSLGVQVDGDSASAALGLANERATALIDAVKGAGVAADDIRTSGLSVWPRYNQSNRVTGFQASNNVTVTIRTLDSAGAVIDAAATAAGDNVTIGGISFSVADPEAVLGAARSAAIENAEKRASEYAAAADAEVGQVLRIAETGAVQVPVISYGEEAARSAADASVPIETGTDELTVSVTVVYELT